MSAADVSYPNISGNSSIVIEGNPVTNIPPTPTVSLVPTAVTPTSTPILPTTTTTPSEISTASPSPTFTIVKLETGDKKVTVTFRVTNDTADIQKFEFNYVDQAGARNKAVTFPKEQIRKDTGDYVWYIPNLSVSKYTLSIAGIGNNGETITGAVSKPFTADLSLLSPEKCTIPTVSGVKLSVQQGKSILSWDSIPEAIRYKVYKKNSNGNYVFVEDTPNINYTIYVSDGVVRYDEFSIRAVCSDGTESTAYSPSTLIQT